ncbi:MAG: hypothetical protein M3S32_02470, partial [Acidobacteriota bacterium]|nr:hypothetical protein [Acidobacteriota bacterium]
MGAPPPTYLRSSPLSTESSTERLAVLLLEEDHDAALAIPGATVVRRHSRRLAPARASENQLKSIEHAELPGAAAVNSSIPRADRREELTNRAPGPADRL